LIASIELAVWFGVVYGRLVVPFLRWKCGFVFVLLYCFLVGGVDEEFWDDLGGKGVLFVIWGRFVWFFYGWGLGFGVGFSGSEVLLVEVICVKRFIGFPRFFLGGGFLFSCLGACSLCLVFLRCCCSLWLQRVMDLIMAHFCLGF